MSAIRFATPPTPYIFEEPIGVLTVNVIAAEADDRRGVVEVQPRIRIEAVVKVRGVAYKIWATYRWESTVRPVYALSTETGALTHWQETGALTHWQEITSQYTRADSGKRPHYETVTYRTLYDSVWRVLGRLAADHPYWQTESRVARLRGLGADQEQCAEAARFDYQEAIEKAAVLRAELAEMLMVAGQPDVRCITGVCLHCQQQVRYSEIDPSLSWVHVQSGNGYCDVESPYDAIMLAGTPGRTEATPSTASIKGA